jgi:hypothetical protein
MSKEIRNINAKELSIYNIVVSVKQWVNYLKKRWWIIGIFGLAGGLLGFYLAYIDKPQYESHLTFALEDRSGSIGGALSIAAEFGFNLGGGSSNLFEGENIISLLTSRRIVERVLLSADTIDGKPISMADYYKKVTTDTTKKLSEKELVLTNVSFPAGKPRSTFTYLQDSILLNLYKSFVDGGILSAKKPDRKLNLYEVAVKTTDERFSKVFTDKLIKEAIDFYTELKTKKSKATLEVLEQRVALTKGNLNNAIVGRADIQDANLNPAFAREQAELQKKQVDISAYGGAYGELYKNLEVARYQYLNDIPLLQIIDGADYPMQRVKKGKLKTAVIYAFVLSVFIVMFFTLEQIISLESKRQKIAVEPTKPTQNPNEHL